MKVKDIFEAFIPRDGAIDERDADHEVRIVVHAPGSLGGTPSVGLSARGIQVGFDWDNGKLLLNPEFPLTRLTPEDVAAIHESVKKGQSWHAYQAHKKTTEKHSEQLQQCKEEIARLKAENAELRQLHGYWKQRAKSAEGHLFSSDFQAACRQLHSMTSFHSTPINELDITQQAKISSAVVGILRTVEHRQTQRRPRDTLVPMLPANSREQFERHFPWAADELEWDGIRYVDASVQLSWVTWQLSRQALVVELPQQSGVNHDWNQAIRYCHQAIEAAGVRTKP